MYYFGYVIESGKGTAEEVELSKQMMRLLGNFGRTGVATTEELDGEWLNFNPGTAQNLLLFLTVTQYSVYLLSRLGLQLILDADALIIDKEANFSMQELWRTDAMVYWKTHLLPTYSCPKGC